MRRASTRVLTAAVVALLALPGHARAQDASATREALRLRREARRELLQQQGDEMQVKNNAALAERLRLEASLRQTLARTVRQRLNLSDDQATRLMDVNRKFSEDRLKLARDEMRIRRELRLSIAGGDSTRSPATGRLLDELLEVQRQRLDVQAKEQTALSDFLTPEQRARYIGMMEQLRRRIQSRADSARGGAPE